MALTIENLTVHSNQVPVLFDVNLSLQPGKLAAVLGANGAGKSELVLAIAGMLKTSEGRICVDGQSITDSAPDTVRRSGVAAVPEGHRVLTALSVEDNLRVAGSVLNNSELNQTLVEVFSLFPELNERKRQLAGTMSGGQQQMLAIGHALMARPRYLLIDEMSLGLAPLIVKRLVSAIRQLLERGTGVLLVEQFTEVALSVADTVTVMRSGSVQFSGSVQQIKEQPEILDQAYF